MRQRYDTRALVLARTPLGEANALLTLLTPGLGLVRARAQGVRQSGAKLSHALTTFAESSVVLIRGKEGWRIAGAALSMSWFTRLPSARARDTLGRICGLLLRLVADDTHDSELFEMIVNFFSAIETLPETEYESAEILAALRTLAILGFDAGDIPGTIYDFSLPTLARVHGERSDYIARINRGISASGL